MGKGKNAGNQHFSISAQYFLPFSKKNSIFFIFILSFANVFNLDQAKNLSFDKEVRDAADHASSEVNHGIIMNP